MNGEPDGGDEGHERGGDGENDERRSWAERLLIATSAVFTILLLAYVIWQGVTTPSATEPTATVIDSETLSGGDVRVTVTLQNNQRVGILRATVAVDCDKPPPELTFEHVPADGQRQGFVTCPSGSENETATVSTWIEA